MFFIKFIQSISKLNLIILCKTYKYFFFLLGIIIESDMLLLTSGYCAGIKILNIYIISIIGFLITIIMNQIFFNIGRKYQQQIRNFIINKKEGYLADKINIFYTYFEKYDNQLSLIFRFIFAIRLTAPIILGTTSISDKQFLFNNIIGGIIWMSVVIGGGYILSFYFPYEKALTIFKYLPFVGFFILFLMFLKSYFSKKK